MDNYKKDCIADTSTLIALAKGEAVDCLGDIFEKVYIPAAVAKECKDYRTAAAITKSFFEITQVKRILPVSNIGKGELEAISLAVELEVSFILMEDDRANKRAVEYNLKPITLSEILILAKRNKFIKSAKAILDAMKSREEGIDGEKYFKILKEAGEL